MADRSSTPSTRLVWLSLVVLVALAAFSQSLHPLVQGFGLAHARFFEETGPGAPLPILVVDNMKRADASSLQQVFPVQVLGRRAYRVYEIFLPTLILASALGVLSRFLSVWLGATINRLRLAGFGRRPLPPGVMWAWLAAGGVVGLSLGQDWRIPLELGLAPFVLAVYGVVAASMRTRPESQSMVRALTTLSATRWFWLGFLALSLAPASTSVAPTAPSWDWPTVSQAFTPWLLAKFALAFCLLHWATRAPARIDLARFSGDPSAVLTICDRLSVLTVRELSFLLPIVAVSSLGHSATNLMQNLSLYLFSSVVCAVLMKWTLQGHPPRNQSWVGRLKGSLCRVLTSVAMVVFGVALGIDVFYFPGHIMPVAVPLILIGVGLVRGQPWLARHRQGEFGAIVPSENAPALPARARRKLGLRGWLAAFAALTSLMVAFAASYNQPAAPPVSSDAVTDAQRSLKSALGYRARMICHRGSSLLIGESLSLDQRLLADRIVREALPGNAVAWVSVAPWRWERAAGLSLILGAVVAGLAFPALLLGAVRRTQPAYGIALATLAGVNGAFAVGSAWGWFWLDPLPNFSIFVLCTAAGWGGAGLASRRPAETADIASPGQPEGQVSDTKPGEKAKTPPAEEVLQVDVLAIELGRALLPLVDVREGAKLLNRMASVRRHIASELGFIIPGVRFRDNLLLEPNTYVIKLRDVEVAQGTLELGRILAIGPEQKLAELLGSRTVDPTYGLPAIWIAPDQKDIAEQMGCMLFDPVSVVATVMTEVCRNATREILTLESVRAMLDGAAKEWPTTVEEVSKKHSLSTLRDVYRALSDERVSIRDQETILNVLVSAEGTLDQLVSACRLELRRAICKEYQNSTGVVRAVVLEPSLERELQQGLRGSEWETDLLDQPLTALFLALEAFAEVGLQPILVVASRLRAPLRNLAKRHPRIKKLVILATDEITPECKLEPVITLSPDDVAATCWTTFV